MTIKQLWSRENVEHTFPIESPPATDRMTPTTLQTSVLIRTTCGILIPFKKHLICGMPLPAATGYTCKIHSWTLTTHKKRVHVHMATAKCGSHRQLWVHTCAHARYVQKWFLTFLFPVILTVDLSTSNLLHQLLLSRVTSLTNLKFLWLSTFK